MSEQDKQTPVLVGVAALQQKLAHYQDALEPIALMEQVLRRAADDALPGQSAALLAQCDEILVPKGIWGYSDPGRLLADAFAAKQARTVLAEIGVSQQTLLTRACARIAEGAANLILVTGAEAKYRSLCAQKAGAEAAETEQSNVAPDVYLEPDSELWSAVESATGLGMPVGFYAIIDSALRYRQGISVAEHRDQMAQMYSRFSEVAAANPDAWVDQTVPAEFIREHSPGNRMLAFPYTKLHNSQWNVDQAAGMVLCSTAFAEANGIPRAQWIYPRAFAESNFMSVVSARTDLGACQGFAKAGEAVMAMSGVNFDDVRLRELYSCFPAAVRIQQQEFGLSDTGDWSVTGAMTFGGGPLNNFVFQATVKMAQLLRQAPTELGLVTTVSGMLTKQACALWSATPNPGGWEFADVTEAVRADTEISTIVAQYSGSAVVAGYTVLYQGDQPSRAVAVFDLPDNQRTVAYSESASVIARMVSDNECCGERFELADGQFH